MICLSQKLFGLTTLLLRAIAATVLYMYSVVIRNVITSVHPRFKVGDGPPLYKYTSSLVPHFSDQSYDSDQKQLPVNINKNLV